MEALDIPQESLFATTIRYALYVGALFQMICLAVVIFMAPKSSTNTTAGTIWSFLKVSAISCGVHVRREKNFSWLFCPPPRFWRTNRSEHKTILSHFYFVVVFRLFPSPSSTDKRVTLTNTVRVIHRHKKHPNDHITVAVNKIRKRDANLLALVAMGTVFQFRYTYTNKQSISFGKHQSFSPQYDRQTKHRQHYFILFCVASIQSQNS